MWHLFSAGTPSQPPRFTTLVAPHVRGGTVEESREGTARRARGSRVGIVCRWRSWNLDPYRPRLYPITSRVSRPISSLGAKYSQTAIATRNGMPRFVIFRVRPAMSPPGATPQPLNRIQDREIARAYTIRARALQLCFLARRGDRRDTKTRKEQRCITPQRLRPASSAILCA